MYLLPKHLAIVLGILFALALAVVLLAAALIRWVRRQRAKDARVYSPETDDPALLHAEIGRLQPCLLQIALDGADELRRGWRESERAELRAGIEGILEEWAARYEGLLAKLGDNRYQLLVQQPMLRRMAEAKFGILDDVRAFQFRGRAAGVTVSIGVGQGRTFGECGANSRQALELALGRGGDQAAVKNPDLSYEFYGGVSRRVERTEKVRVRLTATAFAELIRGCEQVYVMGHGQADFDSLGAAAGVCALARAQNKPAYVVLERDTCMAQPLLTLWSGQEGAPEIIHPRKALNDLNAKTLVVLVDTHVARLAECAQLPERAALTAVIDHHRQAVDHLQGALVFHTDPGASSACEMVTELLQYTEPAPRLSPAQADGLLAGIMLDTRDFVLRTGAATFEAAAWLRARGADPVRVKGLFAGSREDIKRKMDIVLRAQMVGRCAVGVAPPPPVPGQCQRLVCSQAADELLGVEGVDAAFILFAEEGRIYISARSMGARNVQVVMEKLGGGGHQTMAAAQLEGCTMEDAVKALTEAIGE
ncbi:MAG: DHH family phosphoesterase [Firmicutes bacterium]|nr:DHH family phosphoesterase [Bacillota bacterium]